MAINNEFMISEEEINKFIQLINSKIDLIFPDTKNETITGITDNAMRGRLIKSQNLVLDKIAFVFIQKNAPWNVKLISPLLRITRIWIDSWMMKTKIPIKMSRNVLIGLAHALKKTDVKKINIRSK